MCFEELPLSKRSQYSRFWTSELSQPLSLSIALEASRGFHGDAFLSGPYSDTGWR